MSRAAQRSAAASWISQSSSGGQSDLADLQARRAWSAGEEHSVASRRIMACRFVFVAAGSSWARHQLGLRDDTMPAAGPRQGDRPRLALHSTARGKAMQPGFVFSSLLRPTRLEGGGLAGCWTARGSGPSRPAAGPPSGPGGGCRSVVGGNGCRRGGMDAMGCVQCVGTMGLAGSLSPAHSSWRPVGNPEVLPRAQRLGGTAALSSLAREAWSEGWVGRGS